MTGLVDIAMAGSLCKKGEYHSLLNQYGMVIVDECHHAASDTISKVLQEIKARYVYGVTATPIRGDGLERINYNQWSHSNDCDVGTGPLWIRGFRILDAAARRNSTGRVLYKAAG